MRNKTQLNLKDWYSDWHNDPRHPVIHWALLIVIAFVVTTLVIGAIRNYDVSFNKGQAQVEYFVAPNGSATGDGSINNPWDLQTALNGANGVIKPGNIVNLRGGTYIGRFTSTLNGTSSAPIIVRSHPGEWARVDGNYTTTLLSDSPTALPWDYNGTITVSDASMLTLEANIRIDTEQMKVISKNGNVVGVMRGYSGSCPTGTCSAHSSGSKVYLSGTPQLTINGSFARYENFEVTDSSPNRVSQYTPGQYLFDMDRGDGVSLYAPDTKIINLVVHDSAEGIGSWSTATNSELYGNILYNNGWIAPDRGHGHGIYIQNETGTKKTLDNIVFNHFSQALHVYSNKGFLNNLYFEGNLFFNGENIIGGNVPLQNLTLKSNYTYNDGLQIGYAAKNSGLTLMDNFFPTTTSLFYWSNITASGNTIFSRSFNCPIGFVPTSAFDTSTFQFNNNTYYHNTAAFGQLLFCETFHNQGLGYTTEWQAVNGQDLNSKVIEIPEVLPPPLDGSHKMNLTGKNIFLRPNAYDPDRANLIIYNWDKSNTVSVDVSKLNWLNGTDYELRNTLDYFGDVVKGTYNGSGSITVPMTNHTVALPVGYNQALGPNTFPEFGAFVLIRSMPERIQELPPPPPSPPPPVISPLTINSFTASLKDASHVLVSASASGPAYLKKIEFWQANYNSFTCSDTVKTGCQWSRKKSNYAPANSYSWTTSATLGVKRARTYWYGVRVYDVAGSKASESAPIKVIVN